MRFFFSVLTALVLLCYAWGCIDVLARGRRQWVHAARPKSFWILWMLVGLAVIGSRYVAFPLPFRSLVELVLLIGFVYYAGPERQRMGKPDRGAGGSRGGPHRDRGGW